MTKNDRKYDILAKTDFLVLVSKKISVKAIKRNYAKEKIKEIFEIFLCHLWFVYIQIKQIPKGYKKWK